MADTIEDGTQLSQAQKLEQLVRFERLLAHPELGEARRMAEEWEAFPPTLHEGYRELMRELPTLIESATALDTAAWSLIATHTARTAEQMRGFLGRTRGEGMALRDLEDLRAYCYAVAGIVGEMLTELFLNAHPVLMTAATELRRDAAAFGEALQLVNILKDSADDAGEGRRFLPAGTSREAVMALARRDLDTAVGYCRRLEESGAGMGIVGFTALPVLLAQATLDQVALTGPGAKVSREEVARLLGELAIALRQGRVGALLASPTPAV